MNLSMNNTYYSRTQGIPYLCYADKRQSSLCYDVAMYFKTIIGNHNKFVSHLITFYNLFRNNFDTNRDKFKKNILGLS